MPEPTLYAINAQFRRDLAAGEARAADQMLAAYAEAWRAIERALAELGAQIDAARAAGQPVGVSWLYQQDRLAHLVAQVQAQIAGLALIATAATRQAQADAVRAAATDTPQQIAAALGPPPAGVTISFDRLPAEALTDLVGFASDGSPLADLFDQLGPAATVAARNTLIRSVAIGEGARQTARRLKDAADLSMVRALTITRTETLRAFRETQQRTMQANAEVVEAWVWHSALGRRTCAFCWAMHGTVHPLTERMATHPNCRCTMIPQTKTWAQLGVSGVLETRVEVESGDAVFARLSEGEALAILGPGKFRLYQEGALRLRDLVGFREEPQWGWVGYERTLAQLVERPNPHLPPRPVAAPHPRHELRRVNERSWTRRGDRNTVIEPSVDIGADVAAINRGEAIRRGDLFLTGGRLYRLEAGGRLYPVDGVGMRQMSGRAYQALIIYTQLGLTPRAEQVLDNIRDLTPDDRTRARAAYEARGQG